MLCDSSRPGGMSSTILLPGATSSASCWDFRTMILPEVLRAMVLACKAIFSFASASGGGTVDQRDSMLADYMTL